MSSRRKYTKKRRLIEDIKRIQETEALVELALLKSPGPVVDTIRFIQSYSHGGGDYTKERKTWLEKDFDTVVAGIIERRKDRT